LLYFIGSIVLTSYLTLSFKMVERFGIPVFQAIVFNYITCVITGCLVNGSVPVSSVNEPWFLWGGLAGCIFISLFNIIAITTQKIGVAVASVANKLSLVIPFVFSIYLYNEDITWIKIVGIVLALTAVLFTCWPSAHYETAAHKHVKSIAYLLPAVIFIASGFLDTLLKYVEQSFLNQDNTNAFFIVAFATAACLGIVSLTGLVISKRIQFDARSILAGIAIGIPNYFSIWFFIRMLRQYQGNSSAVIPINNIGIVLFSSVMAWLLFREQLRIINWLGIFLAVIAITMIAFG
jgi:drug/metabolite transporter (DMT)-like permease